MKKVILTSVICLLINICGYTQTKQESIKELFRLMKMESSVDEIFTNMIPGMFSQMQKQNKDSISNERSTEISESFMQEAKEMSIKMINEDMVALYDKYFTQNEINDLIIFYKTPSGQKFIEVSPDIQIDLMTVMGQKYIPEIRKSLESKIKESNTNGRK